MPLCEYVAQGAYNKHVLVNTYSGDIIVQSLPATIIFGLYIEFGRPNSGILNPEIEVIISGKVHLKAAMSFGSEGKGVIVVQSFAINFEKNSVLEVFVSSAGFQKTKAISRTITVGAIPGFVPTA